MLARMRSGLRHHIAFGVADLRVTASFCDAVPAPLDQVRLWDGPRSVGCARVGEHGCAAFVIDPEDHRIEAVLEAAL